MKLAWGKHLTTLVYPPRCLGCQTPAAQLDTMRPDAQHWCSRCDQSLRSSGNRCEICAAEFPLSGNGTPGCPFCREVGLKLQGTLALGSYQGLLRELIVRMKNHRNEALAIQLARRLSQSAQLPDWLSKIDCVLPVPQHWIRRWRQQFCAAEIIATTLSQELRQFCTTRWLQCTRQTRKQGTLSMAQRFPNVRHAFRLRRRSAVSGKRILLVDDVMTSGATLNEMAKLLYRAGAQSVYAAILARATGRQS